MNGAASNTDKHIKATRAMHRCNVIFVEALEGMDGGAASCCLKAKVSCPSRAITWAFVWPSAAGLVDAEEGTLRCGPRPALSMPAQVARVSKLICVVITRNSDSDYARQDESNGTRERGNAGRTSNVPSVTGNYLVT